MQYFIFISIFILLTFSTVTIYNMLTLKKNIKESLKISVIFLLVSMPMAIGILIVSFLVLACANWILPDKNTYYNMFIISFGSIFVILIGEIIVKGVFLSIGGLYFQRKYRNINMNKSDMLCAINEKHKSIELLKVLCILGFSYIVFYFFGDLLNLENNFLVSIIISITTSLEYMTIFKIEK